MRADALVVVVDGDGESVLGGLLADDVLLEEGEDLLGLRQFEVGAAAVAGLGQALLDDLVAQLDALVADVHAGPRNELLDLLLALAAEGALEQVGALTDSCHQSTLLLLGRLPDCLEPNPNRCHRGAMRPAGVGNRRDSAQGRRHSRDEPPSAPAIRTTGSSRRDGA